MYSGSMKGLTEVISENHITIQHESRALVNGDYLDISQLDSVTEYKTSNATYKIINICAYIHLLRQKTDRI